MIAAEGFNSDWPLVSVIIVNLNCKRWVEKFFPSVLFAEYPKEKVEIIFIDNGSSDGSVKYVSDNFGHDVRIRIIQNKENIGWSPAVNQGIRASRGDVIVHISSDVEVTPCWLKEIVYIMKSNPRVGIVQCNSISVWDRISSDSARNFLDKYGFSYGYAPGKEPSEVFFAEGMAFAVKREVIKEVGLLDEYYFMEYDDQDFCWRARLGGYKVFFAPRAIVYHVRGGTLGRTYYQRVRNVMLYTRNHFVTLIKNYELRNLLKVLPLTIFIEICKIIYLVFKHKLNLAYSSSKGLLLVLKDLPIVLRKRREVQRKIRRVPDKEVMRYMVPFNPRALVAFLASQARGKRFVLNAEPAIKKMGER